MTGGAGEWMQTYRSKSEFEIQTIVEAFVDGGVSAEKRILEVDLRLQTGWNHFG